MTFACETFAQAVSLRIENCATRPCFDHGGFDPVARAEPAARSRFVFHVERFQCSECGFER